MALKSDGTVWTWGKNNYGQLGDGTTVNRTSAVQVGSLTNIIAIAAGGNHALALRSDGTVWAWGSNNGILEYGQLGNGTTTNSSVPVQVKGAGGTGFLTNIIAIAAGREHSVALKADGTVWNWGSDEYGTLGDDSNYGAGFYSTTPVQMDNTGYWWPLPSDKVVAIAASQNITLVKASSTAAWGFINFYGDAPDCQAANACAPTAPYPTSSWGNNIVAFSAGITHTLVLFSDGTLGACGDNAYGQLGDGTNTGSGSNSGAPTLVSGLTLNYITGIAGTGNKSVQMNADGSVCNCGRNTLGQLGDNSTADKNTPVKVLNLSFIVSVAGGDEYAVVAAMDTAIYTWGENNNGQLGNGTVGGFSGVPVKANNGSSVIALAGGYEYAVSLRGDGTVWSWGDDFYGQLGDGTTLDKSVPVQVGGLSNIVAVAAGSYHSIALRSDGTVLSWGRNLYGQLGDNTTVQKTAPVQVLGPGGVGMLNNIVAIAAGSYFSLAVRADGTVWAWGYNLSGQLGDNTLVNKSVPVQVLGFGGAGVLNNIYTVAAGSLHGIALRSDGTVWSWGNNTNGQLGDGSTTNRSTPVQASGMTDIIGIAGGTGHSVIRRSDAVVFAAGQNTYGQLGNASNTNSSVFVQMSPCGTATPVQWISFTAQPLPDKSVRLNWSAASEINNDHFVMQRIREGEDWEEVGIVSTNSDNRTQQQYSFTNKNPHSGTSYYRLKQVDKNGAFTYSSIVEVFIAIEGDFEVGEIYPNPVVSSFRFVVSSYKDEKIRVEMTDMLGRTIRNADYSLKEGDNKINLDASSLASGSYVLRIVAGNEVVVKKFVKQ